MIEERLGEDAFLDFLHVIYASTISEFSMEDLQPSSEAYTGPPGNSSSTTGSGAGVADWAVQASWCNPPEHVGSKSLKPDWLVDVGGRFEIEAGVSRRGHAPSEGADQ